MKYTLLFVHMEDAGHPEAFEHGRMGGTFFPDKSSPKYEDFLKSVIIEAKMKQLRDMSLNDLIRHFGVEIKSHQNSQVVKRLEINDL
jgi:deoxyhypusine synthase